MEEPRFRSWNGEVMSMSFKMKDLLSDNCGGFIDHNGVSVCFNDSHEMLYAGIKDLCECDLVKFIGGSCDLIGGSYCFDGYSVADNKTFIVKRLDSGFTLLLASKKDSDTPNLVGNVSNYELWNHQSSFKIIGNIYENPELLEPNKPTPESFSIQGTPAELREKTSEIKDKGVEDE